MTVSLEQPRDSAGRFGATPQRSPEVALSVEQPSKSISPKSLGMIGLGPASVNVFKEPHDSDEVRPLRPYLPLTPGDDDEFFDAPLGTRLTVVDGEPGSVRSRDFTRVSYDAWEEQGKPGELSAGKLWSELFDDDGKMLSSLLHAPAGTLYSDKHYFVPAERVDRALSTDDVTTRLAGATHGTLVSRITLGVHGGSGVPPVHQGDLMLALADDGTFTFTPVGGTKHDKSSFHLGQVSAFDRDGDIVFRQEHADGSGWEETLRISERK